MEEIAAEKLVSKRARRPQVAYAPGEGLSQRWACALLKVARSALRASEPREALWIYPGGSVKGGREQRGGFFGREFVVDPVDR